MIDILQIRDGASVLTSEGDKLGEIEQVEDDVLVVRHGRIFRNRYVVPHTAVTEIDRNGIHLAVSSEQVSVLGWDADSAVNRSVDQSIATHADHVPESPEEMLRISTGTGTGEKPKLTGREYGKE